jgi:transcriptional antiterminator
MLAKERRPLRELREFIAESRRQVLRAVDVVQASLSLITLAMIAARAVNILG